MHTVQHIAVILNPAAGNGAGHPTFEYARESVARNFPNAHAVFIETENRKHAIEVAATTKADLFVVIGGDGTLNEIAQGVFTLPQEQRPALALISMGTGNDYARTTGSPLDPREALDTLPQAVRVTVDVGRCYSHDLGQETYYLETMSFGVDAAVALNAVELREKKNKAGVSVYARAAVSAICRELKPFHAICHINGESIESDMLIFAIQNGPTYGGGFRVAPHASITDGLLNVCFAHRIGRIRALLYLMRIKSGTHEAIPAFSIHTTDQLEIRLDRQLPIQCDGERVLGTHFTINNVPAALDIMVPPSSPVLAKLAAERKVGVE